MFRVWTLLSDGLVWEALSYYLCGYKQVSDFTFLTCKVEVRVDPPHWVSYACEMLAQKVSYDGDNDVGFQRALQTSLMKFLWLRSCASIFLSIKWCTRVFIL